MTQPTAENLLALDRIAEALEGIRDCAGYIGDQLNDMTHNLELLAGAKDPEDEIGGQLLKALERIETALSRDLTHSIERVANR